MCDAVTQVRPMIPPETRPFLPLGRLPSLLILPSDGVIPPGSLKLTQLCTETASTLPATQCKRRRQQKKPAGLPNDFVSLFISEEASQTPPPSAFSGQRPRCQGIPEDHRGGTSERRATMRVHDGESDARVLSIQSSVVSGCVLSPLDCMAS